MAQLDYQAPSSVEDAVRALAAAPAAKVLAGGTDLIVQMRSGRTKPGVIIDLKRIPGAIGVRRESDGAFVIGAALDLGRADQIGRFHHARPGGGEGRVLG